MESDMKTRKKADSRNGKKILHSEQEIKRQDD